MVVLTKYIARHELEPLKRLVNIDDILDGANKVIKGLAVETKAPRDLRGCRFFKVRNGKRNNARMMVFVITENKKVVPVLIRLKKDKVFGVNMAMNNPIVIEQMNKNLNHILDDLKKKQYQEFS